MKDKLLELLLKKLKKPLLKRNDLLGKNESRDVRKHGDVWVPEAKNLCRDADNEADAKEWRNANELP